jgi:hypothetical protein
MDIIAHIDAALFMLSFCCFAGAGVVAAVGPPRQALVAALFVLGTASLCGMALTFTPWDYSSH